jgi:hypothetical protein
MTLRFALFFMAVASAAVAQPSSPSNKKSPPLSINEKRSLLGLVPGEALATTRLSARAPYAARPIEAGLTVMGFTDAARDDFVVQNGGPFVSGVTITAKAKRKYLVDCFVGSKDTPQSSLVLDYVPRTGTARPKAVLRGEGHVTLIIEPPDDGDATVSLTPQADPEVTGTIRFRIDYCEVSSKG